jgi:hypothetical protein
LEVTTYGGQVVSLLTGKTYGAGPKCHIYVVGRQKEEDGGKISKFKKKKQEAKAAKAKTQHIKTLAKLSTVRILA